MDGSDNASVATGAASGAAIAGPVGALVGGGLSLLGGLSSASKARRQADERFKWDQFVTHNAHRIERNDLIRAGLNPILTATGGAGASHGGSPIGPVPDLSSAASSATAAGRAVEEIRNMRAQNEAIGAETAKKRAETKTEDELREDRRQLMISQAVQANASRNVLEAQERNEQERFKVLQNDVKMGAQDLQIGASAAARARTEEAIDESTFGKALRWIDRASKAIQGAGSSANSWRRRER